MRRFLRPLFGVLLRVFFRRNEARGDAPEGASLYTANHPSALIDPLFLFCYAPQEVSFLAKEPLFRMPFISWFVKGMKCLPVYRRQDGANTAENKATIEAARGLLAAGGAIALFPEGTSHSDSKMKPLRTGAARLALGAASGGETVQVVPVGLHYSDKSIFRSDALLTFGPAISVPKVDLDDAAEPPRDATHALTNQIKEGMDAIVVQAESDDALDLIRRAESIFSAVESSQEGLHRRADVLQAFADRLGEIQAKAPEALSSLREKIDRHHALLEQLGLPASHPHLRDFTVKNVTTYSLRNLVMLLLWAPLALVGWLWHAPAYYAVRAIVFLSKGDVDQAATVKLCAALLLFPLSWSAVGAAVGWQLNWISGVCVALSGPFLGYIVLVFKERIEKLSLSTRALTAFLNRRAHLARLSVQREAIHQDIISLGSAVD